MGLLTNEAGSDYDTDNEANQAQRRAQLEAYNAARQAAGETPNPTQDDDDVVIALDLQTGSPIPIPVSEFGGGGRPAAIGTSFDPIIMAGAEWFVINSGYSEPEFVGWDYDNGEDGVGATITASDNGALVGLVVSYEPDRLNFLADGGMIGAGTEPQEGDRVLLVDTSQGYAQGVYTITDVGSVGSPWVWTRAVDADDIEDSARDYRINLAGTNFFAVTARYYGTDDDFGQSTGQYGWAVMTMSSMALGAGAIAIGDGSMAIGREAMALGHESIALGRNVVASGTGSIVLQGSSSVDYAVVINSAVIRNHQLELASDADIVLDFASARYRLLALAHNVTFTTQPQPGVTLNVRIVCDGTPRTFTFPEWKWLTAIPTGIAAGKTGVLTLISWDSYDQQITASYGVEA